MTPVNRNEHLTPELERTVAEAFGLSTSELERKAEALGLIHYHRLRARRARFIWWTLTAVAATLGTISWSWFAIPIVVVVSFVGSSLLSHRTTKLVERQTGLTAAEQWELLCNPEPFFDASFNNKVNR